LRPEGSYVESFVLAENGTESGYIRMATVDATQEVKMLFDKIMKDENEKRFAKYDAEREALKAKEEAETKEGKKTRSEEIKTRFSKYGSRVIQNIIDEKIWVGMTDDMLLYSWGQPDKINTTVTTTGKHEQHVYFEKGKLTSFQYSK